MRISKGVTLLFALAIIGLTAIIAFSVTQSSAAVGEEIRFAALSVRQPSNQDIVVFPEVLPPGTAEMPSGGPVIIVKSEVNAGALLLLDAETGAVISDSLSKQYPAEVRAILGSATVNQGRPNDWPYSVNRDTAAVETHYAGIAYVVPKRSSGVLVSPGRSDGPAGSQNTLFVHNGRSRLLLDADTGATLRDLVLDEDRAAFDGFQAAVRKDPK